MLEHIKNACEGIVKMSFHFILNIEKEIHDIDLVLILPPRLNIHEDRASQMVTPLDYQMKSVTISKYIKTKQISARKRHFLDIRNWKFFLQFLTSDGSC